MTAAEHDCLVVGVDGGVMLVELNRPERRNAIDEPLQERLRAVLSDAAVDPGVRGVVLTGRGPAFSAGGDLARFDRDWDPAVFRFHSHRLTELVTLVERIEKPVIAAINGLATGAGTQLALACDLRLAAASATLVFREGHIGLVPTHGGCARLVKLVGLGRARDILLGGEDLDAAEAHRLGLVTEVVPDDRLLARARERLERIFRRSPESYGMAKRLLTVTAGMDLASGMAVESLGQSLLIGTDEHRRRVRAALDRATGEPERGP